MRNLTIRSLGQETEAFARNTLTVKSASLWLTAEEIFLHRWTIENIEGKARYKKGKITRKERQQIVCLFCSQLEGFFFLPLNADQLCRMEIIGRNPAINPRSSDLLVLCSICLEDVNENRTTSHRQCDANFCDSCFGAYIRLQITQGKWELECANCSLLLSEEIIQRFLQDYPLLQEHFARLLADAYTDPLVKTCPNCCVLTRAKKEQTKHVVCSECHFDWCFSCHAPWHKGMNCKDFKRGSKLFKAWTKSTTEGAKNARRCPKCKIFIQRLEGCDQMSCPRCRTQFCYLCGERIVHSRILGGHWSIYSVLGCRYIYKQNQPVQRKIIRGLFMSIVLTSLPILAVIFLTVSPAYGVYYLHKYIRRH